ncbi:MAG: phosphoribosylamine--glycine ligase [Betaproteobacteria bacterium RIFCSPLOWO2_02_67_12]|nr:MAG: phosphoribosylamine--glycine ligase [Betaproteobacteria bacterium RIFCSPLOWO2_02_67_12]OGA26616.1 MAG: phosphoribosylamine--glycine ligase [Betaproteobacteria bacterium RIFCSPLOWO2_02_FULL_68_150]OGA62933.1 MAG: phosphoribosylamine--glycine ligase [Betaproteobacteria bacterium RIFCSPLOWO2_12_FULL_67_28]
MKLLVIGSGGREHALAWKLAQNPRVQKVFVAPGNGGTAAETGLENVALGAIPELIEFARRESVGLTLVGPEAPLAAGIVDAFRKADLRIFGPTRAAAQLESSKDFAKQFMVRHAIPTARHATFTRASEARAYIERQGVPIVIKADGLAAGKGVVVAGTVDEALAAVDAMLLRQTLGDAGARVVIEECLTGEEASFIVICDGSHALALATSQDHKRLRDGDAGPNTGGMGAYSPAPVITPEVHARVMREIIQPTLQGMAADGVPYSGFLYAGLMIDAAGNPKTLEFNCRLGDPEAQPIILRLKSDLFALLEHALEGSLDRAEVEWDRRAALGVVLAAAGYPEAPRMGDPIQGLPKANDACRVFHAGTRLEGKQLVTHGGRVLCVTALGDSLRVARSRAYEAAASIRFDGMQFRKDIGHRALKRP